MANQKNDLDLILGARQQAAHARRSSSGPSDAPTSAAASENTAGSLAASFLPQYEGFDEVHRGGQGVVYRARHRSSGRVVAIKVLREGPFASAADRLRFEREVQILGSLRHPNIVAIHDSGSAGGFFYYVMDFVDGAPLDRALAGLLCTATPAAPIARAQLQETARLFAEIGEAVNEAHLRGVIHRDLKPGNILVASQDPATSASRDGSASAVPRSAAPGGGAARLAPKILDFGLARPINPEGDSGGARLMTQTGQFIGSLPWASPEQVEGRRAGLDLRTDVYSLGVLLYQGLTGVFPYDTTGPIREAMDRIVNEAPPPPSTRRRGIDRELDAIVLRCLAKEPARRYQNAGDLARDLRRYVAGEAIDARRDSALYVLRKLASRHRAALLAIGGIATTVAAALAGLSVMYARQVELTARAEELGRIAAAERDRANTAAEDARRKFRLARETTEFLLEEFSSRLRSLPGSAKLRRELLTEAYERYEKLAEDHGDDPGLALDRVRVRDNLGGIAAELGRVAEATAHYEAALCWVETLAADQPDNWRVIASHAAIYNSLGDLAMRQQDVEAAESHYRRHYEINLKLLDIDPGSEGFRRRVAIACDRLGVVSSRLGRPEEAAGWQREAHALMEALWIADPNDATRCHSVASSHNRLGDLARLRGDLPAAAAHFEQALAFCEELLAQVPDNPSYTWTQSFAFERLSVVAEQRGDKEAARNWADQMFGAKERLATGSPDHPTYRYELALAGLRVARLAANQRPTVARAHVHEALAALEELCEAEPQNPAYRSAREAARAQLAEIP